MNPAINQATKLLTDTKELLSPLELNEISHIFVPFNDFTDASN